MDMIFPRAGGGRAAAKIKFWLCSTLPYCALHSMGRIVMIDA